MAYQVLARKYRPQTFSAMIGQEHIGLALQNSLKSGKIGHAYLFYGPRGVGKTTSARIMAKVLNCKDLGDGAEPCNQCISCQEITRGACSDVLEIDAASTRGIDNIRNLRENIKFTPMSNKYKIYIIDEIHMLTLESFNALLKTIEEPPEHVKFIFATTDYHKIPVTILSRCQEFHFRRVGPELLLKNIEAILGKEEVPFEEEALFWIINRADGSVRDSLSILDQAIAYCQGNLKSAEVRELLGVPSLEFQEKMLAALLKGDYGRVTSLVNDILTSGGNLKDFLWDFLGFTRAHNHIAHGLRDSHIIGVPASEMGTYLSRAEELPQHRWQELVTGIYKLYQQLSVLKTSHGVEEKIFTEIGLDRIATEIRRPSISHLLSTVDRLANRFLEAGLPAGVSTTTPALDDNSPSVAKPAPENSPRPGAVQTVHKGTPAGPDATQAPGQPDQSISVSAGQSSQGEQDPVEKIPPTSSNPGNNLRPVEKARPEGERNSGGEMGIDEHDIKDMFAGADVTDEKGQMRPEQN